MSLSFKKLLDSIDINGIEYTLSIIDIEEVDDHAIRTILHVIDNSLDSLRNELEDIIQVENLD